MKKLIIIVIALCSMALTTGCSTGKYDSGNLQQDFNALSTFNVEWQSSGQPLVDEIGSNICINVEENKVKLDEGLNNAEALKLLNQITRDLENVWEELGIENPTESQEEEMKYKIVSEWTQDERETVETYWRSKSAKLAEASDDAEEIIGMIKRSIPKINQTMARIEADGATGMIEKAKLAYAIGKSLKQVNELLDWSLNCERLLDEVQGAGEDADAYMRESRLQREGR